MKKAFHERPRICLEVDCDRFAVSTHDVSQFGFAFGQETFSCVTANQWRVIKISPEPGTFRGDARIELL